MAQEWPGQTSQKFTTWRKHVEGPKTDNTIHPLYAIPNKKHFEIKPTKEFEWKSSSRPVPGAYAPRVERAQGTKKVEQTFSNLEPKSGKAITNKGAQTTATFEDNMKGIVTFAHHNRKTVDEFCLEDKMQIKQRVGTIKDQRNGLPMVSCGDKIYKAVEYLPGFYKEGGLIVGST